MNFRLKQRSVSLYIPRFLHKAKSHHRIQQNIIHLDLQLQVYPKSGHVWHYIAHRSKAPKILGPTHTPPEIKTTRHTKIGRRRRGLITLPRIVSCHWRHNGMPVVPLQVVSSVFLFSTLSNKSVLCLHE